MSDASRKQRAPFQGTGGSLSTSGETAWQR